MECLTIINTRVFFLVVRDTHRDMHRTASSKAVSGGEAYPVDPAVSLSGTFGPKEDVLPLDYGIRARVAIARTIDRLILRHVGIFHSSSKELIRRGT